MTRLSNSRTAMAGMLAGVFLACAQLPPADDALKPGEVTSTFAVTGMT